MKTQTTLWEQQKSERLRQLLESADFLLLTEFLSSEIARLEAEAITVAPWVDKTQNAKSRFDQLLAKISQRKSAQDLFSDYHKPDFQFYTITLNP